MTWRDIFFHEYFYSAILIGWCVWLIFGDKILKTTRLSSPDWDQIKGSFNNKYDHEEEDYLKTLYYSKRFGGWEFPDDLNEFTDKFIEQKFSASEGVIVKFSEREKSRELLKEKFEEEIKFISDSVKYKNIDRPVWILMIPSMLIVIFIFGVANLSLYFGQDFRTQKKLNELSDTSELLTQSPDLSLAISELNIVSDKLQSSDSVSEIKKLTSELTEKVVSVSTILENQSQAASKLAVELNNAQESLERKEELIKLTQRLNDNDYNALREFFFNESRESSRNLFWLGVIFTFIMQIFVTAINAPLSNFVRRRFAAVNEQESLKKNEV